MTTAFCRHCNRAMKADDYVYVINREAYCSTCFQSFVVPQARMTAKEYANSWGCQARLADKE